MEPQKIRREMRWFVPLWLSGAFFMVFPSWLIVVIVPLAAILATTPFRAGRMTALEGSVVLSAGVLAAAGLGLLLRSLMGR